MKKFILVVSIIALVWFLISDKKQDVAPKAPGPEISDEKEKEKEDARPRDFIAIQESAEYSGVTKPGAAPSITGDAEVDRYIRAKAEARGYRLRPNAIESRLVSYQGQRLQPEAKVAIETMQAAAQEEGLTLTFASGYRSVTRQREIFVGKLGTYDKTDLLAGKEDAEIDSILKVSSVPGYSKHHTGYAVDLGCDSYELTNAFMETPCYAWLAGNDFAQARKFGFVPSYAVGGGVQGPDPESWEFILIPRLVDTEVE